MSQGVPEEELVGQAFRGLLAASATSSTPAEDESWAALGAGVAALNTDTTSGSSRNLRNTERQRAEGFSAS
jgi:hypothetical protein